MSKKTLLSLIITISLIIISCESYKKESALVVKCPQLKTVYGITTLNGNKFTGSCELEEDNIVYEIKSFKKGLPHGVHKRYYYPSDKLEYIGYRKNGKIHGEYNKYHENGQIESHGNYKYTEIGVYSRKDGVWKYYYDNGQIQSESIIKDGVEELKFYDKEGNLLPEGEC